MWPILGLDCIVKEMSSACLFSQIRSGMRLLDNNLGAFGMVASLETVD